MRLHNISDHPKFSAVEVRYKGGKIRPGESVDLDPTFIPNTPFLVTELPEFYVDWKNSKFVTPELLESMFGEKIIEDSKEEKPIKKKNK